jgi:catechol 2,3-dioxygenase-like lactoylglutathione lyase family enzyme
MPSFEAASFVLAVPDAVATATWWVEAMGFERMFETKGWVFVRRGACVLHLGSCPDALPPHELGDHSYFAYVTVDSVDDLHAEIRGRGVDVFLPPTDRPWGAREMGVRTPDGHRLMFASHATTDVIEDEALWIGARVRRLRELTPTFSDPRVLNLFDDLVTSAEQRLAALARRRGST